MWIELSAICQTSRTDLWGSALYKLWVWNTVGKKNIITAIWASGLEGLHKAGPFSFIPTPPTFIGTNQRELRNLKLEPEV